MGKQYIDIIAEFTPAGTVTPLMMKDENGRRFSISRITDRMPAASQKSGGLGMRYTCYIGTRMFYLYKEEERWFVENPES